MESKLAAVLAGLATGGALPVSEVCANLGISRETYYKYRRRFETEGLSGLAPRSRRPHSSPTLTSAEMTERVVRARKDLDNEGWDNGAISVWYRLISEGAQDPPAVRTIHRVLVRAGLVDPDPSKARRSRRRFVFPATDDCWHIDAFEYALADGTVVVIFELEDDHSRYLVGNLAWPKEDTIGAWRCLATAINEYGTIPVMLLNDNGLAFTGKHVDRIVLFERNLAALGIKAITTRPYHPQTNGKNERLHGTTRKWLAKQPPAGSLAELQAQLDTYRQRYNNDRPHQALNGETPAQRRVSGMRRQPRQVTLGDVIQPITTVIDAITDKRGAFGGVPGCRIRLGTAHANKRITVFNTNGVVLIFHGHNIIGELTIDPTHRLQVLNPGPAVFRLSPEQGPPETHQNPQPPHRSRRPGQ